MDLPQYQYDPIKKTRSTRLLRLEPGVKFSPLKISLDTVSLDQHPLFEAISYFWGDPTFNNPIVCNGKRLDIAQNLKDALENFRREDESRFLWADAICINQNDLEERASQVRLMWDIYALASHCIVWLGKPTADTVSAIFLIKDLVHEMFGKEADSLPKNGDIREKMKQTSFSLRRVPHLDSPLWQSVVTFFDRPYFSRIWVIQEINACAAVTVFCGTYQLDWAHIVATAQWIGTDSDGNKKLQLQQLAKTHGWWTAGNMSTVFKRHSAPKNVAQILQAFHACKATDWRDKIFALLGFEVVKTALAAVKVDYPIPVENLYTQVAKIILGQDEKLDLLSYHWHGEVDEHVNSSLPTRSAFPSWVPRWHEPPDQQTLLLGPLSVYDASGGLKRDMTIIDEKTLRVTGNIFDNITTVGEMKWIEVSRDASRYSTLMAPLLTMPFYIGGEDPLQELSQEVLDSFLCAITAGLDEYQERMDNHQIRAYEFRTRFYNWYNALWRSGFNIFPGRYQMYFESKRAPGWEEFQWAAYTATRGRFLFMTEKGRIGVGPIGTSKGDFVCALHGGNVLYVLRPIDEHFLLIGEAYVRGAMDGEIVKDEMKWPKRSFDIY